LGITSSIINAICRSRMKNIHSWMYAPQYCQHKTRENFIERCVDTAFGEIYQFKKIQNYSDFKTQIPIFDYETFQPFIERCLNGEQQVFWHEDIRFFSKSSGTTSHRQKLIPVSQSSLYQGHYKASKDMMSFWCTNNTNTKVWEGNSLIMGGSLQQSKNAVIGDVSAINIKNMPYLWKMRLALNDNTLLERDFEKKLDIICKNALAMNISSISGVPSWTIYLLNAICEKYAIKNISEIWENVELYVHGGVSFLPYIHSFKKLLPKTVFYEAYNASEGFFGITCENNAKEMLLLLNHGVFYEFIEAHNFYKNNFETIELENVEIGKNYVIVITTNAGLWRYVIGDTIVFTNTSPYMFTISGRTKMCINVFGEEVIIDNVEKALADTCNKHNCEVEEFHVYPLMENASSGKHIWIIEFKHEPKSIQEFEITLDLMLKMKNSDYEAKRTGNLLLQHLKIIQLPKQTFYNYYKTKNKLGGQNKIPRMSTNTDFADELLYFVRNFNAEKNE
jgi:hypothetical protein